MRYPHFTESILRFALAGSFAVGCASADLEGPVSLSYGLPVGAQITRTIAPAGDTPGLEINALGNSVHVLWKIESNGCTDLSLTARFLPPRLLLSIDESFDPLVDCAINTRLYRLEITTVALPRGTYQVRLLDSMPGRSAMEIGHATVVIGN